MQPPSKSKTWANEDSTSTDKTAPQVVENVLVHDDDGQSDDEYQHMSKKRKRSPEVINKAHGDPKLKEFNAVDHAVAAIVGSTVDATERDGEINEQVEVVPAAPAASDADWLRSRTSRLLGLIDDDDSMMASNTLANGVDSSKVNEAPINVSVTRKSSDASVQTNTEDVGLGTEETATEKIPEDLLETIKTNTGRLFVRNLSYTVSENDLRAQFGSYGDLEEVSTPQACLARPSTQTIIAHRSCDEYPDRDNLCYAYDDTWKSVLVDAS